MESRSSPCPNAVLTLPRACRSISESIGHCGVVEPRTDPDFHSASSDVPVWSTDGRQVFFTAKVGDSIELMRVDLDGKVTQLT